MENKTLSGKQSIALLITGVAVIAAIALFQNRTPDAPPAPPSIGAEAARYEGQKLASFLKGMHGAAFTDVILKDDEKYTAYFERGLKSAVSVAPAADPAFAPYTSCIEAADNLMKFAELRRAGRGQNDQSDQYRQPFWNAYERCQKSTA